MLLVLIRVPQHMFSWRNKKKCFVDTPLLSGAQSYSQNAFTIFTMNIGTPPYHTWFKSKNQSLFLPANASNNCKWCRPWSVICRLNELPHTINWKSPVSILGTSGYVI